MRNLVILFTALFVYFVGIYAQSVCIDPGHGGSDPGAVGCGLREANINLDTGLRFYNLLKSAGYSVYMTRTTDATVSLSSRTQYANNLGVDRFISIHCNAFNGSANGTETFCYPGVGGVTVRLRDRTNPEVVAALGTYNRGCKTADFHVLRETNMPAILCELAFIDHSGDAAKLGDGYYRQRAAEALKRGLINAGLTLAEEDAPVFYTAPQFSADGTQLIVKKTGSHKLYSVSVEGGKIAVLQNRLANPIEPRVVAFAHENEIFVKGLDGQAKQITHSQDVFFAPAVSPDGNWVVYQGLSTGIYLTNLATQETKLIGAGNNACWTPDSQAILFDVSKDDGQKIISSQIQMIQVQAPDVITIISTRSGLKAQHPSVSPDGSQVAFESDGKIFITGLQAKSTCTEVAIEE